MDLAKILLVDDHALFRRGVRTIIEHERDLQVVGEAQSCQEALLLAQESHPDLILMDICFSDNGGIETITALKQKLPATKIVVLTVHDEDKNRYKAISNGAEDFLSKGVRAKVLVESLRNVMWEDRHIIASHLDSSYGPGSSAHKTRAKI